jgi:ATP-binding protein involved in chromosome partitioning
MNMAISKEDVLRALGSVEEPDLKKDLVTLQMVKDVTVDGNKISFTIVLTTPACPLKELIRKNCVDALKKHIHPEVVVEIAMVADVTSIRLGNTPLLPEVRNIIAIASGKGGVGKSTITANLAIALSKAGAKVGIIDADISGPSMPVMFDVENEKPRVTQENGKNMILPVMQYGIKLMSIGFLASPDAAVVWRGPMASSALKQFIADTIWGALDYLLIDLPPGTSDIHLTLVQTVPVTGAIIVTTPQKVALADAQKGLSMFKQPQINVPVLGVVENMSYFTPAEMPENKYFIFGEGGGKALAEKNNVPLLGQIPLVQRIRESGDSGRPVVLNNDISAEAFKSLAESVAQHVSIRNAQLEQTKRVEIKI